MALLGTGVPPLTGFAVDFLEDVGARQSRNRYEPDLLLDDVPAGLQERLEFGHAFVEALALPLDLRA